MKGPYRALANGPCRALVKGRYTLRAASFGPPAAGGLELRGLSIGAGQDPTRLGLVPFWAPKRDQPRLGRLLAGPSKAGPPPGFPKFSLRLLRGLPVDRSPVFYVQEIGPEIVGFWGSKRHPPTGKPLEKVGGEAPHLFRLVSRWEGLFRPPETDDFRTDFLKIRN